MMLPRRLLATVAVCALAQAPFAPAYDRTYPTPSVGTAPVGDASRQSANTAFVGMAVANLKTYLLGFLQQNYTLQVGSAASLRSLVGFSGVLVHRVGYTAPGDGGEADYAFSSSACGTDDGGSCENAAGGGSWVLDQAARLAPAMFGNNFQALATAAMALNKRALVPCGTYNGVPPISVTVPNGRVFSMHGESQGCVYINFTSSGLTVTLQGVTNNDFSAADIQDMSLATLDTTGTSTGLTVQANFVNNNPAFTATSTISRVSFQALNGAYWAYGLIDTGVSNLNADEITYAGASQKGSGILIQGYKPDSSNAGNDGYAVSVNVTNFIGFNAASGIVRGDFVQGVTLANPQCTGCANGALIPGSTLAPSNIQFHVRGGQFGVGAGGFGINCYDPNTGYLDIEGGLYLLGGGAMGVKSCGTSPKVVHATFGGDGNANNVAIDLANPASSTDSTRNSATVAENIINGSPTGIKEEAGITSLVYLINNVFQVPATGNNYVLGMNDSAVVVDTIPRTVAQVNALVPCTQGTKGSRFIVTDAASPAFMAQVAGGGTRTAQVTCDGSLAAYVAY